MQLAAALIDMNGECFANALAARGRHWTLSMSTSSSRSVADGGAPSLYSMCGALEVGVKAIVGRSQDPVLLYAEMSNPRCGCGVQTRGTETDGPVGMAMGHHEYLPLVSVSSGWRTSKATPGCGSCEDRMDHNGTAGRLGGSDLHHCRCIRSRMMIDVEKAPMNPQQRQVSVRRKHE